MDTTANQESGGRWVVFALAALCAFAVGCGEVTPLDVDAGEVGTGGVKGRLGSGGEPGGAGGGLAGSGGASWSAYCDATPYPCDRATQICGASTTGNPFACTTACAGCASGTKCVGGNVCAPCTAGDGCGTTAGTGGQLSGTGGRIAAGIGGNIGGGGSTGIGGASGTGGAIAARITAPSTGSTVALDGSGLASVSFETSFPVFTVDVFVDPSPPYKCQAPDTVFAGEVLATGSMYQGLGSGTIGVPMNFCTSPTGAHTIWLEFHSQSGSIVATANVAVTTL